MLDDSKEAGIGHNSGAELPYDVTKFQPLELRAREIADAGADWLKLPKIETEEQAQKANDFLAQVKKIEKDTEAERKAQKAPHDARAKAVDAAFKLLLDPLGKITGPVKTKLLAFADEKRRAEEAAKARAAAEAREAEAEAARLKAQAEERGDVFGAAEAEAKAKEAEKMAKAAAKPVKTQIKSATGGGRTLSARTIKRARITNINIAFAHFRDHPNKEFGQFLETSLIRMAESELRRADGPDKIPGFEPYDERNIA